MEIKLAVLDSEDEELRKNLILDAYDLIKKEKIKVPKYSDEDLVAFAMEWQYRGSVSDQARKMLKEKPELYKWVYERYSHDRLYILFRFSKGFGDWVSPEEMLKMFGDFLKLFIAIKGEVPEWCRDFPFHTLLCVAFVEVNRRVRAREIRKYLREHWDEATKLLEFHEGVPSDAYPKVPGTEFGHIYTQYKRAVAERERAKVRRYIKEVGVDGLRQTE